MNSLAQFPDEILCHMAQFLSPKDLFHLYLASKKFLFLWNDPFIWRYFSRRDFPSLTEPQREDEKETYRNLFYRSTIKISCGLKHLIFSQKDILYHVELPIGKQTIWDCSVSTTHLSDTVNSISSGESHFGVITNRETSTWGENTHGQLGTGFYGFSCSRESLEPVNLQNVSGKPIRISCGLLNTGIVTQESELYVCGGIRSTDFSCETRLQHVPVDSKVQQISMGGPNIAISTKDGFQLIITSVTGERTTYKFPQFRPMSMSVSGFLTFIIHEKNLYCVSSQILKGSEIKPVPYLEEPYQVSSTESLCGGLDKKGVFIWDKILSPNSWYPQEPPLRPKLPFEPLEIAFSRCYAVAITRKGIALWKWKDWDGTYRLFEI